MASPLRGCGGDRFGMRALHYLKTWPCSFDPIEAGTKTFEYRRNDRGFLIGDVLVLQRYDPHTQGYTGEVIRRIVTYIILGGDVPGLPVGYCIMQIAEEESDGAKAGEGGGQA